MSNTIERRHQTYNAIYKSDIFNINPMNEPQTQNQKPHKKMIEQSISTTTQIKLFGNNNNNGIYDNQPIPHKKSSPIQLNKPISNSNMNYNHEVKDITKSRTAYDRFLREFHNAEIDLTKISNTKGYLVSELKQIQPTKQIIATSTSNNRIDSLKSNIFNDIQKEHDNRSGSATNISNNIQRNNWNTNLDWKNSQSELILKKHQANNSIAHCQTLNDYYNSKQQNQNIIRHRYIIFPANNIDGIELAKEFRDKGYAYYFYLTNLTSVHIYDVEKHSDWLNGHGSHLLYFYIRDNDRKAFQLQFNAIKEKIEKEKAIQINFVSCDKAGIDKDINSNINSLNNSNTIKHNQIIPHSNKEYLGMTSYNRPFTGK